MTVGTECRRSVCWVYCAIILCKDMNSKLCLYFSVNEYEYEIMYVFVRGSHNIPTLFFLLFLLELRFLFFFLLSLFFRFFFRFFLAESESLLSLSLSLLSAAPASVAALSLAIIFRNRAFFSLRLSWAKNADSMSSSSSESLRILYSLPPLMVPPVWVVVVSSGEWVGCRLF